MMARTILKKLFPEKSNDKIINLFCSNSESKLTPRYSIEYYFHFLPILAKSNDLISLKVQKLCFSFLIYPYGASSYMY